MKVKFFTFVFCFLPLFGSASSQVSSPSNLEVKTGYFFFTSSRMQCVYDEGGLDVQLSGTLGFWHWMRLYGSMEYLQKSGHSLNIHQPTSIWELPLSFGLQTWIPVFTSSDDHKKVAFYLTLGPRYSFVFVRNHSKYVDNKMKENGIGGFANLGLFASINPHLNFDFFGEYSYARLHFHSSHFETQGHTVQIGGLAFGAAVGYAF